MTHMTIDQAIDAAMEHHRAGRLREAEAIYRQILAQNPNYPDALNLLGALASQTGNHQVAVELISRAIQGNPNAIDWYLNLGYSLTALGKKEEAIQVYRSVLRLAPQLTEIHNSTANLLDELGRHDEAIAVLQQAIADAAPSADVYYNLGNALRRAGHLPQAIEAYRQAIQIQPGFARALSNMALALRDSGQTRESVNLFEQAIAAQPDWALPHFDLASSLLALGEFERGWQEYEWRSNCNEIGQVCSDFPQPRWDGGPLDGRRILIHCEQGFGDTIQFCRYVPKVAAEHGGEVIFQCQPEVAALARTLQPAVRVIARNEPLPDFDVHCPLMSLPLKFNTTLQNIPAKVPYLRSDCERARHWSDRLANIGAKLKIGLAWAGHVDHTRDKQRSLSLADLAPLAQISGAKFISLQKGPSAVQAAAPPDGTTLIDWTDELNDFSDTAALIEGLDLVIAVDTAVAHLAGALGRPIWVPLPHVADWRWLMDRDDSPWYPTMKLFRQPARGDWKTPILRIFQAHEMVETSS